MKNVINRQTILTNNENEDNRLKVFKTLYNFNSDISNISKLNMLEFDNWFQQERIVKLIDNIKEKLDNILIINYE